MESELLRKLILIIILFAVILNLWIAPCQAVPADQHPEINVSPLKQQIRQIITDRRFSYPDPLGWWAKIWDKIFGPFWDKIGKKVADLFHKLIKWLMKFKNPSLSRSKDPLSRIVEYIGFACLILLPFLLVYYLPRMFRKEHHPKAVRTETELVSPKPFRLLEQAALLSARGELREAIRTLYLAVLEDYKIRGVLPNGKVLSDKENLMLLRRYYGSDHPAYRAFDQIIRIFREKWYGLRNCQPLDYDNALRLSKTIMENAGKIDAKY